MPAQLLASQFGQLIGLHEDVQPVEFLLRENICTIGRAADCQIVVSRHTISRLHARIERSGQRYILHDAGSVNGTYINSSQIHEPHLLKDRDLIGLGGATALLRFVDPDPTFRQSGRLRYDERALVFFLEERPIELTPAQFRLLLHLYQHIGEVCTRENCAQAIWGRDYDPGMDAEALDRTINTLRGRLRLVDETADLIHTRRGLGYTLTP